jgi:hypothetical protein
MKCQGMVVRQQIPARLQATLPEYWWASELAKAASSKISSDLAATPGVKCQGTVVPQPPQGQRWSSTRRLFCYSLVVPTITYYAVHIDIDCQPAEFREASRSKSRLSNSSVKFRQR